MNSPETPPADPFADDIAEGKIFRDLDLFNPTENKVKDAVISLDAAVGIVAAMGMTVSGFGDAPKRHRQP